MATTSTPSLGKRSNGKLAAECPMCGQPLLDPDAVERVEHAQRDLDAAMEVRAARVAKQIAKDEQQATKQRIEKLTGQLKTQQEAIAQQKEEHQAEVRKLRVSIRADLTTEAEKAAATKVQREIRQKNALIEKLREQTEEQQRRIEHLRGDERGEMNEEDLVARLQAAFPDDHIERQGRGRAGADIVHEVRCSTGEKVVVAGRIVYECKDTLQWNNSFVDQATKARATHDTPHVVIVSRAFPRGQKELCVREGVPIVAPARLVEFACVLREMVIQLHRAALTKDDQAAKTEELYAYLAGNDFRQAFNVLVDSAKSLNELLNKERTAHERTWAKRQQFYNDLGAKTAAIDGRLHAIIERTDKGHAKVVPLAREAAS